MSCFVAWADGVSAYRSHCLTTFTRLCRLVRRGELRCPLTDIAAAWLEAHLNGVQDRRSSQRRRLSFDFHCAIR